MYIESYVQYTLFYVVKSTMMKNAEENHKNNSFYLRNELVH